MKIDLSRYDTDNDPFLDAAKLRISQLEAKRSQEQNFLNTIAAEIDRLEREIEGIRDQVKTYNETGEIGPGLTVDDEKNIKHETQKIVRSHRKQEDVQRQLNAELDAVEVPDGWTRKHTIGVDGKVVVTLTSLNQVAPSEHSVRHKVAQAFQALRTRQRHRFAGHLIAGSITDPVDHPKTPWDRQTPPAQAP